MKLTGFRSLSARILVAMTILAVLPLLVMALQGLHCARQAIIELEEARLESVLGGVRDRLANWLSEREQDLRLAGVLACGCGACAGHDAHMAEAGWDALHDGTGSAYYESLALYDEAGQRIGGRLGRGHDAPGSLFDAALRERLATETGMVVSATHPHDTGRMGLHLALRTPRGAGTNEVYVAANVDLTRLLEETMNGSRRLGETGRLYLVSPAGRYLTAPDGRPERIGQTAALPDPLLRATAQGVRTYEDSDGNRVLGASTRLPMLEWVLVAEVSRDEALGWLAVLGWRAVTTGLITFAVVLVLAMRFARHLAEPLRELASTARRIARGSHRQRVGRLQGAEVDDVGRAFNEMLDALAEAQQRVAHSASLAAIGELSASVVHEMRNPLSSIKMNLQALRRKVEDDPGHAELAEIALAQAQRLERMLAELLRFGKPVELRLADVPFAALAEDALAALKPEADAREVRVHVDDRLAGRPLHVDREQMRRVLENLVRNAIEASPAGATVHLSADAFPADPFLAEVRVVDEGAGIPEGVRERLFQPFVTTRSGGTGLGLANVKKIVELHGGEVAAENRSAGGACFAVRIPFGEDRA